MGGKAKPMYTPSDAFLSIPEVATMKVGDAVMMAKAYKNGQPTEEEAPIIFAACDGDSLKLVSATVTAAHGSSFIALGEAMSSPKSGCDNAALTAGAVMDAGDDVVDLGGVDARARGQLAQAVRQQVEHRITPHPLRFETLERRGDIGARFGRHALAILGQVGKHREQHEAAHEIQRAVQIERIQFGHRGGAGRGAAVALNTGAADCLGLRVQFFPAIAADHIAEDAAQEADVGVLRDRGKVSHDACCALQHRGRQGGAD